MRGDVLTNRKPTGICEICNDRPAVVVVQGETDSMGFEAEERCQTCHEGVEASNVDWWLAKDVEDRAGTFLVSSSSNHERYSICEAFKSYRQAVSACRAFSRQCEPYGGTYPKHDLMPEECADAFERAQKAAEREAADWAALQELEMQEDEILE